MICSDGIQWCYKTTLSYQQRSVISGALGVSERWVRSISDDSDTDTPISERQGMENRTQLSFFDDPPPPPPDQSTGEPGTDDVLAFLALMRLSGVGFATIRALFSGLNGQLSKVWDEQGGDLVGILQRAKIPQAASVVEQIKQPPPDFLGKAQEHLEALRRRSISLIFRDTPAYPRPLYDLKDPPAWLFVEGDASLLHDPNIVAVIGTRSPTEDGIVVARELSNLLIRGGCVILSGLAVGIDEVGHRASVDFGAPTIAVLGHGIDVLFPTATASIRTQLVKLGGAVVSEYLPNDSYSRERFLQRNRIQAALSRAVAVVEGQTYSGTSVTVRVAGELGRPLFGVRSGARPSDPSKQEIFDHVQQRGGQVFNIGTTQGHGDLRSYLRSLFPEGGHRQSRHAQNRLFTGVLREVERIIDEYKPKGKEIQWLVRQIEQYYQDRRSGSDDNQSGDP